MKEEKPKLSLNKRIVARLNNLEMRHVRGGEGGGTDVSNVFCTESDKREPEPEPNQDPPTFIKTLTTIFLTKIAC